MVMIILLFAFGAFGLDAGLYLKRRAEVQALASNVAMAAGQALPYKGTAASQTGVIGTALKWYDVLRTDPDGNEIAPAAGACSTSGDGTVNCGAIEIKVLDNVGGSVPPSLVNPYRTYGVNVTVNVTYTPEIFPIKDQNLPNIPLTGKSAVQPVATDVVFIIDNTASFIDTSTSVTTPTAFSTPWGATVGGRYAHQCFSEPWRKFKQGVIQLYDRLVSLETVRVGVITSTSRGGKPFILANLGSKTVTASDLDTTLSGYADDVADHIDTRCAAMTTAGNYQVPQNLNHADGYWQPREDLNTLLSACSDDGLTLCMADSTNLLIREAIWLLNAGFSTEGGFIPPRYYYASPKAAIDIAKVMLLNSRRNDNLPVVDRYIVILSDDAGLVPSGVSSPQNPGWSETQDPCDYWYTNAANNTYEAQIKLGFVFFGHDVANSAFAYGHDYNDDSIGEPISNLQSNCLKPEDATRKGIFFVENSPTRPFDHLETGNSNIYDDFPTHAAPMIAHALKRLEFRKP